MPTPSPLGARPGVGRERRRRDLSPRWRMFWNTPTAVGAAVWLTLLTAVAVVLPFFVTTAANRQDLGLRFVPPFGLDHGLAFVLGADSLGRPMLLQLIVGARTSLLVATAAVLLSAAIGFFVGVVSGYLGGWVDMILMRLADVLHTVPSLLLALAVLYVLEPSVINLVLVLAITRIPVYLRTTRAQTLELRERVFVEFSRSIGAARWRIMFRDVAPMVVPTLRTVAMLEISNVILAAASLSFLGIGLQRPDVDWGMMVADGRAYLSAAWWATVLPGAVIVVTALSANILSNWLRAVEDPTQSAMFLKRPQTPRRTAVAS